MLTIRTVASNNKLINHQRFLYKSQLILLMTSTWVFRVALRSHVTVDQLSRLTQCPIRVDCGWVFQGLWFNGWRHIHTLGIYRSRSHTASKHAGLGSTRLFSNCKPRKNPDEHYFYFLKLLTRQPYKVFCWMSSEAGWPNKSCAQDPGPQSSPGMGSTVHASTSLCVQSSESYLLLRLRSDILEQYNSLS